MLALEQLIRKISILMASGILLAMMGQVVLDVILRSFFGAGFPATGDVVSRYYMVAISLLPLALTQIDQRHIEVSILTDRFGPRAKRINQIFCLSVALLCFGLLTWFTGAEALHQTARKSYVEAGTLVVPTWPSYWFPPVSSFLMSVVLILQLLRALGGSSEQPSDQPKESL